MPDFSIEYPTTILCFKLKHDNVFIYIIISMYENWPTFSLSTIGKFYSVLSSLNLKLFQVITLARFVFLDDSKTNSRVKLDGFIGWNIW